jgi:hypothetical protein
MCNYCTLSKIKIIYFICPVVDRLRNLYYPKYMVLHQEGVTSYPINFGNLTPIMGYGLAVNRQEPYGEWLSYVKTATKLW